MLYVIEGVYPWTSDHGSRIFSFASPLLLCHLIIIFMPMYLSWTDILVTVFQYRALLFALTVVFLSVSLIVVFVGLSAEWLRAWSWSNNQLLHPHYHRDEYEGMDSRWITCTISDIGQCMSLLMCMHYHCLGTWYTIAKYFWWLWERVIIIESDRRLYLTFKFVTDDIVLSTQLDQLVPTQSLYAEVFVQTESTSEVLSSQNAEDQGSKEV